MRYRHRLKLMATEADRAMLAPILEALSGMGVSARPEERRKGATVLVALSERFYADESSVNALLNLIAADGNRILPVQLDEAGIPDAIKNTLYSRNIIPAFGREPGLVAERILDTLPEKRIISRPVILTGAALVLLGLGALIWLSTRPEEALPDVKETAEQPISVPLPAGVTEEDLASVVAVTLIGDESYFVTEEELHNGPPEAIYDAGVRIFEGDEPKWLSKKDGHTCEMTRYEDLRFLQLMPNLKYLSLAEVDPGLLPDLSGSEHLESVSLSDTTVSDLSWLAGSSLERFDIHNTEVTDYAPLSACEKLYYAQIDLAWKTTSDLSGFAPPALEDYVLVNGYQMESGVDLSSLATCKELTSLRIEGTDFPDLAFLQGKESLERLEVKYCRSLRDVSALSSLKGLKTLDIEYCPAITDYSPIGGCERLEELHLQCDENPGALRDASFLADLQKLNNIGLYAVELRDLDFLEGIARYQDSILFGFAGDIGDYSGLSALQAYDYLHVHPREGARADRAGDFSRVQPYIQNAKIKHLILYQCDNVDLGALPDGIERLEIHRGTRTDLQGLQTEGLTELVLKECQYLTSLEGLQELPEFYSGVCPALSISLCPHLTDYTALEGAELGYLTIVGQYELPDFGNFRTQNLHLEEIPDLTDLSCLDTLRDDRDINLELVGLDAIDNLSTLSRFHGARLTVPPQVSDQAAELVAEGKYTNYEVAYPDREWLQEDGPFELLSLEELSTLSPALLRRVETLCLAGDTVVSLNFGHLEEYWEEGAEKPQIIYRDDETHEMTVLEYEGGITDLSILSELTGLRELYLIDQPLESLDGIQMLPELETLSVLGGEDLTDISAAFACQGLQRLTLKRTAASSLQGIQNLMDLIDVNIPNNPGIQDLTPLLTLEQLEHVCVTRKDMGEALDTLEGEDYHFALEILD